MTVARPGLNEGAGTLRGEPDTDPTVARIRLGTRLRRPVGGAAVMRAQIGHLLEISELRHVNIQVLPFRAGGHAAGGGPVILLRFAGDQLPDVVYLEQLTSAVYPSKPSELASYWDMLNQLATQADPPIASTMILNQIRKEF